MTDIITDNISLILLLPLWIFLIIMCGRFFSLYVNKKIIYLLTLLSSFLGAGVCGAALIKLKEPISYIYHYPFIRINHFMITFGLQIDRLSLLIAFILFLVSFAVQLFSISYMKTEKKTYKFFAYLNLFNFAMAFLLFSPNLFQFYVFWELVGVVSYLLIGFDYKDTIKSEASKRVFLMNRIGDTALLAGIIITSYFMYDLGYTSFVTLSMQDLNVISTLLMAFTSTPEFLLICGLFILAAMVKSAQFPFYTWLQEAMEAKLPVSALLHSATMVVAGVYLIIKLMPFFTLNQHLTQIILIIGLLTAIICSVLASIETQPKKVLAYSTSANLGLMFFALGIGNVKAAVILLCAHAFIKSMLFILLPKDKVISKTNYVLFVIGALSLGGILFSGLSSKELIYQGIIAFNSLSKLYLIISFITGYYIIRLALFLYKTAKNSEGLTNQFSRIELISYLILLSWNIGLYIILRGTYHIKEPYVAAIGGICLALLLYNRGTLDKLSKTPKLLEKLYNNFVPYLYGGISKCADYIDNKIFSDYKPILNLLKTGVKIVDWIEINLLNKTVTLVGDISKYISKKDILLQSGNIQTYNAYAFIIITIVTALLIIGYTIILN